MIQTGLKFKRFPMANSKDKAKKAIPETCAYTVEIFKAGCKKCGLGET
jgi:hypothetical protein